MITLSQRDPRWAPAKLGNSQLTCGRYGCTTTCISMLSDYFGNYTTPGSLASNPTNYTHDGLVLWSMLKIEGFHFTRRQYGRFDDDIKKALADPDRAVILEVANKSHWVVATGKPIVGTAYKIADPWLGDRSTIARYNNDITGAAYFQRN